MQTLVERLAQDQELQWVDACLREVVQAGASQCLLEPLLPIRSHKDAAQLWVVWLSLQGPP